MKQYRAEDVIRHYWGEENVKKFVEDLLKKKPERVLKKRIQKKKLKKRPKRKRIDILSPPT